MPLNLILFASFFFLQTSASFGETFPDLKNLGVINTEKVLKESGARIPKANKTLIDLAKQNQIQIIYQEAVYVASKVDLTIPLINAIKSDQQSKDLMIQDLQKNPAVALINAEKIFNESKQGLAMLATLKAEFGDQQNYSKSKLDRRTLQLRTEIANNVNSLISQYAEKQGISLVLQEAAYVNSNADITDDLMKLFNQEITLDQIPQKEYFKKPMKVAVVDAEKIFANFQDLSANTNEEKIRVRNEVAQRANPALKDYAIKNSIAIISQSVAYVTDDLNITPQIIASLRKAPSAPTTQTDSISTILENAKEKCLSLGFKANTESYGKCVLQLAK